MVIKFVTVNRTVPLIHIPVVGDGDDEDITESVAMP